MLMALGLLVLRLVVGLGLLWHGWQKVFGGMEEFTALVQGIQFPLPGFFSWVAALAELIGGALVALGFLARIAAIPPAIGLAVALLWVHWGQSFAGGWELPALYLAGLLAVVGCGPGKLSVDGLAFGRGS